jgi:hypothetical protein
MPIGTLMKKIHRQPAAEVSTPPTSTPMAEPAPPIAAQIPSALLRSLPVKAVVTSASADGDSSAAPIPWAARPASSIVLLAASPLSKEAPVKTARPASMTWRAPSRSARRPPSSIRPPKARVYAVSTQVRVGRSRCRCAPMAGSATLTTVTSRMSISFARDSNPSASQRREGGPPPGAARSAGAAALVVIDRVSDMTISPNSCVWSSRLRGDLAMAGAAPAGRGGPAASAVSPGGCCGFAGRRCRGRTLV